MATTVLPPPGADLLDHRYERRAGRVFLTGTQALVRMLLDQRWADERAGQRTGIMVSGYQGSPLGGFDREVAGLGDRAAESDLVHRPGVNEELGATAVWGSQLATALPGPRVDGVLGVWYGKSPGFDRAADAIRHGNFVGADPRGGAIALCGDDAECKSSTLPSGSESIMASLEIPVFCPSSVQDCLDLGRHAIACSRASGLWTAVKMPTAVADAGATVDVGPDRVRPLMPSLEWEGAPYVHRPSARLLAPDSLAMERTLRGIRLPLAVEYARLNDINVVTAPAPRAAVGVITRGGTHREVQQALADLGVPADRVRVLKVGMPYPLDERVVRDFARDLEEVVVIEEKGPFLERLVRDALYGAAHRPLVSGVADPDGRPLVPTDGALYADRVSAALGARLLAHGEPAEVRARLDVIQAAASRELPVVGATRTAAFCSGCPHNTSTKAGGDVLVGAGIGCHTLILANPEGRGDVAGITQMGGEGAQWIGAAPFVATRHVVQNVGDGTFHHSGSLAIRAAVAAGLDVTYKLLYNDAVAMTGGQPVAGQLPVAALVDSLAAEGVARIVVTTDDVDRYRGVRLAAIAEVRPRTAFERTQRELASVAGVTVIVHDQACATELRRARKRGKAVEPPQAIVINERVCEGCGDCGERSGCLSVEPVQTEFGRKTRIHQSSCNKDFSCVAGDCPSFLEVTPGPSGALTVERARAVVDAAAGPSAPLPLPAPCVPADDVRLRMVGIGGTGVVTVSQVLATAAMLDGLEVASVDQTGLSQKAGPVSSDVRISRGAVAGGAAASSASIDVLIGLDVVATATAKHLVLADPERTVAAVSTSVVPTVAMVLDPAAPAPDVAAACAGIGAVSRGDASVFFDAQELAMALFGSHMPANVMVLGAAWQLGAVPVSLESLRAAFTLNGTAVKQNLAAFEWGRAVVAAPEAVAAATAPGDVPAPLAPAHAALVAEVVRETGGGELRRLLEVRVPDLAGWGGERAARRYVEVLRDVVARERERDPGSTAVSEAVAIGLHKLMAYKDEYEVARLHLRELPTIAPDAKVKFLLHPPALRALGMQRKLKLGRWFVPAFRVLTALRPLRGTALDPFGRAEVRRVERALPGEYVAAVTAALERLDASTRDAVVALAQLPDMVRGYEDIKLHNVQRYRSALAAAVSS